MGEGNNYCGNMELYVQNLNGDRYMQFIRQLRRELSSSTESLGVPHLVPEITDRRELTRRASNPREIQTAFLNFTLRTNDHQVTFRILRGNVYLTGYRDESGVWWEFGRDNANQDPVHLIPGSSYLGIGENYNDLLPRNPPDETDSGGANQIYITFESLMNAVNALAVTTDFDIRKKNLFVVVVMICEAARLNPIFLKVANGNATYTAQMRDWIQNWGNLSAQICLYKADPTSEFRKNKKFKNVPDLDSVFQASNRLGLIKDYRYWPNGSDITTTPAPRPGRRLLVCDGDGEPYYFEGLPLVEIFSVRIDKSEENESEIYGRITVDDGLAQSIYSRGSSDYEEVYKGGDITLTGPNQSIWATREFTIYCHLKDEDSPDPDDEIVDDFFSWDALAVSNMSNYDKLLTQQVRGRWGSATVNFAVLRNAVAARIAITINEGGEDTVQVYGNVAASYSDWTNPTATSVLFNRPVQSYVNVKRGRDLPLSRSVVAVPMDSSLKITASLIDCDSGWTRDDEIVKSFVEFPAETSGQSKKEMHASNGHWITVTIDWGYV